MTLAIIIIQMTKNIEALKHIQDDQSLNNKVEDLTSRLQELSSRSQQDVKDLSEKFQTTMAIFEARLQDLETRKVTTVETALSPP